MRISEISRELRTFYYEQSSRAEQIRRELMPYVELDDDELELFAGYIDDLQRIGINLENERLQSALNVNPHNMEAAIQAVLQYAENLRVKDKTFRNRYHATNCLAKALQDGWQPRYYL